MPRRSAPRLGRPVELIPVLLVLLLVPILTPPAHALDPGVAYRCATARSRRRGRRPLPGTEQRGSGASTSAPSMPSTTRSSSPRRIDERGRDLVPTLTASDIDLVHGESKTFRVSSYPGDGVVSLSTFGLGDLVDLITLPTNGAWEVEVDVTDLWNDAIGRGDALFGVRIHDPVWTGHADRGEHDPGRGDAARWRAGAGARGRARRRLTGTARLGDPAQGVGRAQGAVRPYSIDPSGCTS
ncbi:MAG: hypothetical protein R3E53_01115 [Myxococcota bacterium]